MGRLAQVGLLRELALSSAHTTTSTDSLMKTSPPQFLWEVSENTSHRCVPCPQSQEIRLGVGL